MKLEELKKEAEELKGQIETTKKDLDALNFEKVRSAIAQEIGSTFMIKAGVQVEKNERCTRVAKTNWEQGLAALKTIDDQSVRLGMADSVSLTGEFDGGHTCCPDDNPRPYLNKMEGLGFKDLVIHSGNCYHIEPENFSKAADALIEKLGSDEQKTRLNSLQSQKIAAEEKLKAAEKKASEIATEIRLEETLKGQVVSPEARAFLASVFTNDLKVVDPDTLVYLKERSEWGSSGGVGYFDQVHVYYHGQTEMEEWQWRDRYSASKDRHDLRIEGLGKVSVSEENGEARIEIELINEEYGNRSTSFTFSAKEKTSSVTLSEQEQSAFAEKVKEEMTSVLKEKERLWAMKPQMRPDYPAGMTLPMGLPSSYVPYRRPSIKERLILASLGIAAFVVEEQIDHRVDDPQIRYELYVVKHGQGKAENVYEDHSYEKGQGNAVIALVQLKPDKALINTRNGKVTVKF